MNKSNTNRLIVVLGMHRSGTSAITRGLMALGVGLGSNLMPPQEDNNEKGFWEDIDISNLDDEILHYLGYDWHTLTSIQQKELERDDLDLFRLRAVELLRGKIKDTPIFGLKDPRFARLLPFWKKVFKHLGIKAGYIIAVRHPLSVADSLNKREGFELEKSSYLWLCHIVPAMLDSEGSPRVVVDYDLLMMHPNKQLCRIAEALKLPFDGSSPGIDNYVKEFLAEDLRHTQFHINDLKSAPEIPQEVVEAYYLLDKLARDQVSENSKEVHESFIQSAENLNKMHPAFNYMSKRDSKIADLNRTVAERDAQIADLNQTAAERNKQIDRLNQMIAERERQITGIFNSKSWRLTLPLREIGRLITVQKQQKK